ncbi:Thiamine-phosphate synthase [compost metagenome]
MNQDQIRHYLQMYLVVGSVNCKASDPITIVKAALSGGVTLVQFREKGADALQGADLLRLALQIQALCRAEGVPFIINDDVDLALEIDADGVHIGQDDENAGAVRAKIGDRILGVSAHTVSEARFAMQQGADYLGIGPIYPTHSKDDAHEVQGTAILCELRENGIHVPLVGIGGITEERAAEVIKAGADGVAVISAITEAKDVHETVVRMKSKVGNTLRERITSQRLI